MSNVRTRKRGKYWEYEFDAAKVAGKRNRISKSGYKTKAEAGMPQKYTQQRLGHKDISVTLQYYTHLTDKMSEIGGKILESMFADNDDD